MKIQRLGFTGTRMGLTDLQDDNLWELLLQLTPGTVHHGGAIGADGRFAELVTRLDPPPVVVLHPCGIARQQDRLSARRASEVREPLPPLERNRNIVAAVEALIACPAGEEEELRSGTWATVRHARRQGKPLAILYPSGRVELERWEF